MKYFIMILVMVSVSVKQPAAEKSNRSKRVFNGFEIWKSQVYHYKAAEYFVWIGKQWDCVSGTAWWNAWGLAPPDVGTRRFLSGQEAGPRCSEDPNRLVCGGTLLAPRIVHSACHCFTQATVYDEQWLVNNHRINTDLTNSLQVYMGGPHIYDFWNPIEVREVRLHPKCASLSFIPHYFESDFAWVVLQESVPTGEGVALGTWGTRLDYAGPYWEHDIQVLYDKVVKEKHVCLLIGFGSDSSITQRVPTITLKHGYVQLMDWFSCYHWRVEALDAFHIRPQVKLNYIDDFNKSFTGVCAHRLPSFEQGVAPGDSGGPLSCNGVYFALVSEVTSLPTPIRGVRVCDVFSAVKHDAYAVAVEHRVRFEADVLNLPGLQGAGQQWLHPGLSRRIQGGTFIRNISASSHDVLNNAVYALSASTQLSIGCVAIVLSWRLKS